jgi:hypothetical protein
VSVISEIAESLRGEFKADLRATRTTVRNQVNTIRKDVADLRGEHETYHVETTRALAHVGDELAALRELVQPLAQARARRARALARAQWLVKSTPGLLTTATATAGAIAAAIALF